MRLATFWKLAGGLLLAVVLLGWVLREADPAAVWQSLGRASLLGLLAGTALNFSQTVPRVWRWGALLAPVRADVPFRPMFAAVTLGYAVSWVVPGRLGEVVRPALLSARERLPLGACLGSVVADRLLDGVAVLALFAIGIAVTPLEGESLAHASQIRKWSFVVVGVIAVPIAALLVLSANRARIERWSASSGRVRHWLAGALLSLSRGIESLKRPALLARVLLHTAGTWLLIVSGTWIAVRGCGARVSFGGMLVIMPLLVLGIALPTPGGAGGYHAGMMFGLTRFLGVEEPVAAGAAILVWATVILPVVLAGAILLFTERIPVRELLRLGRGPQPAAPRPT